ncbi:unnamed protein product [Pedinophyceae sp. YPF-701]|nr:unnamed protein product [Pedinophyceae sp. YPF-701]
MRVLESGFRLFRVFFGRLRKRGQPSCAPSITGCVAAALGVGVVLLLLMLLRGDEADRSVFRAKSIEIRASGPFTVNETAVCLAGTLRTFVFRGVYMDLAQTVIEPLQADVFVDVELDLLEFGRDTNLQIADLDMALQALPTEPKAINIYKEQRWFNMGCIGDGHEPAGESGAEHNCLWVDRMEFKQMWGHDRGPQYWRLRSCFDLIREYEARAWSRYRYVVRLRTDVRVTAFPAARDSPGDFRKQLEEAMRDQHRKEACLVPGVDAAHGTLRDEFAVCTRGAAEHYMRLADELMDTLEWTQLGCPTDPWDAYAVECVLGTKLQRAKVAVAALTDWDRHWTRICSEGYELVQCKADNDFIVDTAREYGITLP